MKMLPRAQDCDASIDPATKAWPYLAIDVQDPGECLAQCRERFITEVVAAPADDKAALCEAMNSTAKAGGDLAFGWLYCCSSVLCGVSFDRVKGDTGQDPNVKRIVDDCQNLDYTSVLDPGVPPDTFTCPTSSVYTPDEPHACNLVTATDLKSTSLEPSSSTPSDSASQRDPTPDTDLTPSHDTPATSQPGLSTGVKAAIGVLSFLAFLALISTLLYLLRRRYPTKYRHPRSAKAAHSPPSSSSSPSRLVSTPTYRPGAALAPPLRLKDRRLLPTLMGSPARREESRATFPASPICAPTISRLVPRNENAPLPPFAPAKPRSSTSSGSSASRESPRASAEPPSRPPRPHDAPLQIPDLVAPAGPPPERALPETPVASPKADIGLAVSRNSEVPGRERDSVDEYGRARASWGSWGTRVVSPVLGEDELERMGGRYT